MVGDVLWEKIKKSCPRSDLENIHKWGPSETCLQKDLQKTCLLSI